VGEIDSTGRSGEVLANAPLRGRCYRELTGFHLDAAGARQLVRDRRVAPGPRLATGLSPHAPYSVSGPLFRAAARASRHLAIHCAEVPEEQEFLRCGTGPFAALLQRLGRLPAGFRAPGVGAVRWLERLGVLRPTTLLVHCQELERGDRARIAAAGARIVVCPGTIAWFGRAAPPVPSWLRAGIPVALGTDSRASNDGLSLLAELRRAGRLWPALSPRQLLAMGTRHGGAALGLRGVGTLRRGAAADFLVVPPAATFERTLEGLFAGELPVQQVHVDGRPAQNVPRR
jgi:cytosine/adenosine deaminase-related metal-dependent hydrolase